LLIFFIPGFAIYKARINLANNLGLSESVIRNVSLAYFAIILIVLGFINTPGAGTGWKLQNDQLAIKAWPIKKTMDVKAIQFAIIDKDSEWQPKHRTAKGMSHPLLGVGWFKLNNNKDAVVFFQNPYSQGLLILYEDKYYFLATPGTEELTQNLKIQGAKELTL
jgi:hypothetical protein